MQMTLKTKDTLPLPYHSWLRQELAEFMKTGKISSSIANFASPVIIVPKKKDLSPKEMS